VPSDPDAWRIEHRVVHCSLSHSYQRPICSVYCPACDARFDPIRGAAEIARLTLARDETWRMRRIYGLRRRLWRVIDIRRRSIG
jgi:hypothetical protein